MSTITEKEFQARPDEAILRARTDGSILIRCDDGTSFLLQEIVGEAPEIKSPLDVGVVEGLHLTRDEILEMIHDGRRSKYGND